MTLKKFSLEGKVAIVTGSSTGLGEGMAYGLAQAGADIVGVYNKDLPANREKIEAMGRKFMGIQADLSSIAPVADIIDKTVATFGRLDILVNNAGVIRRNPSLDFTEKDWDDVLNVNLKTLFFLSQAAARQFVRQKTGGKIINIASMLSFQGGFSKYSSINTWWIMLCANPVPTICFNSSSS